MPRNFGKSTMLTSFPGVAVATCADPVWGNSASKEKVAALIKNFLLPRERASLQFRAEFYNLFNHPNLYVNGPSTDVSAGSFTNSNRDFIAGVTASFRDNRQIVLALKLIF